MIQNHIVSRIRRDGGSKIFSKMADRSDVQSQTGLQRLNSEDRKTCWVCFATEDDDRAATWTQPCRCKGTTRWVHHSCLQRWIDEKQRGRSNTVVSCPQCNTEYRIVFPKLGPLMYLIDVADRIVYKVVPYAAAGMVVGSIYWSAVSYGAFTVMQVLGHKEGLDIIESVDPIFLLVTLPTIPIMLILAKMIHWEDYVLRVWRRHSSKIPLLNYLFPSRQENRQVPRAPTEPAPLSDPVSATRLLCSALLFPSIATLWGKLMFSTVDSNLQRTILGGIAFVVIKGVLRIYYKQQQYLRQAQRKIQDFVPEDEQAPTQHAQ
ncbi:E3 ubiquitin-protein ligase MARCHF5-like [Branchiostoma lanceolatum]|uniref:E3 ubiquitin-protein ligase MARCHF5-like n=1 Tax=Branchiostoma lanceolatum TaxID=7740 RepID=UPI00345477DF